MTNYVDDDTSSIYDIPAYDTESSLVILYIIKLFISQLNSKNKNTKLV